MTRLYYDQAVFDADPSESSALDASTTLNRQVSQGYKDYLTKVVLLIPSEIVALYTALIGLAKDSAKHTWIPKAIFIGCLLLTIFYMKYQADKTRPYIVHIVISTVAFVVWSYSISGDIVFSEIYHPTIASISLILFSLISGKISLTR